MPVLVQSRSSFRGRILREGSNRELIRLS
jgi:hypothetical protein